jgi:uncharacterized protein
MIRVGLISDTHGLLRPQAVEFLRGCDCIVHSGDIGNAGILQELSQLAPVTAVRGNNDKGEWAERLPQAEFLQIGEVFVYVIHDLAEIDLDPQAAGVSVVVTGHSHAPAVRHANGVLYINPGSAGPRRFKLPIAVGELNVDGDQVSGRTVELTCPKIR